MTMSFGAPMKHLQNIENNIEEQPLQTDDMTGQARCITDEDNVVYLQSGMCF